MVAQSSGRISGPERERAAADDERERAVHALTEQYPPDVLERVLRSLDDHDTALTGLPPLVAALAFRDAALTTARARRLTALEIRRLAAATSAGGRPGTPPAAPEPLFDRALFVFGLRRGANHAISEWLRGHFADDEVLYLNSAELSLLRTEGGALTVDRAGHTRIPVAPAERVLLVGYENLDPALFALRHNERVARRSDVVVVLRDYPNMAASIARQARDDPAFAYRYRIRDLLELWKRYAGYFEEGSFGFRYVSFNAWFADPAERRRLSEGLGLPPSDRGLNRVSGYGLGSSFDGREHDGRAQRMAVLERWRSMLDDQLFQFLLLADDEALEASARIFGGFPYGRTELLERWRSGGPGR